MAQMFSEAQINEYNTLTVSMDGVSTPNGVPTPSSEQTNGMPLTEYAANPMPSAQAPASSQVPKALQLPDGFPDYLRLILDSRVYEILEPTPLTTAVNLGKRLESNVLLKREDLQPVFSFKLRGAYNRMAQLPTNESWKGVIACSAGNHAQGVAYAARRLKIPATIVMPEGTPPIKTNNVSRLGGLVKLYGGDFDAAKKEAYRLQKEHALTMIPPFDDPYVIAGQGTIALELHQQTKLREVEAIFCCVGGGGLIAGIGAYVKRMAPHVKVIGVEAYDANAMAQSLRLGKRVVLDEVGLFADGAAVKTVGEETFRLCKDVVDEVIEVSTDEICAAIKDFYDDTRSSVEPAGALSIAGLKKYVEKNPSPDANRKLIAIASGANMNFDRLRFVAERASLGEGKEVLLSVTIPERPGAFAELVKAVLPLAVTEFSYRYSDDRTANILMGVSVKNSERAQTVTDLFSRLEQQGMPATDLSHDETAKSHIRYLVGGPSGVADERLYMFEFPERPGALNNFLTTLRPDQNISLFRYRNDGGDMGRVLAGIQCPTEKREELDEFLVKLGYPFRDNSDSESYKMFLRK